MWKNVNIRLTTAAIFIAMLAGCATPQAVRTLSEEQIKVQESLLKSQKKYFTVIESFVESQIKVTEALVLTATLEINDKYKKKALKGIDPNDEGKTKKALNELAENILKEHKADQEGFARIKGYHTQLKELHQRMLKALSTIVAAQKKLNEYIQLKKTDEVAVSQLLTIVGLERDKVEETATVAANVYGEIENYIKGGAEK